MRVKSQPAGLVRTDLNSLKCQTVLLTREKFSVWKKVKEGETGREGAANLRGREVFERKLDTEGTAEILLRECRKGEKTYGQSTRHESEVRLRNG